MRTTVTPKQRVLATLVKWTSLFLILLAVMTSTISGELPIARTTFSRTSVPSSFKDHCPPAPSSNTTPSPSGGQCVFVPTNKGECGSYTDATAKGSTVTVDICVTAPIKDNTSNNVPAPSTEAPKAQDPSGCPPDFTSVPDNKNLCRNKRNSTQTVLSSCAVGFVHVDSTCFSNQTFDLVDQSSGACTLTPQGEEGEGSGEEGGSTIYWCPYANGTNLRCVITGTDEQCTMTRSGAEIGKFDCHRLTAHNPGNCRYNHNADHGLASATCAQGTCTIQACLNTKISPVYIFAITGSNCTAGIEKMKVTISEKCTPQVDGAIRICHYNSTGGSSTKAETLSISCSNSAPITLTCSVSGPYDVTFNKLQAVKLPPRPGTPFMQRVGPACAQGR